MCLTPRPGCEDEHATLSTEMRRLLPTVVSAFHCHEHGWVSIEARDFWETEFFLVFRKLLSLEEGPWLPACEPICKYRELISSLQHSIGGEPH